MLRRRLGRTVTSMVTVLVLSACAGSAGLDSPDAGRTTAYEPGVPNFDMESIVRLEGERPIVEVLYSLPFATLVFVKSDDRYVAGFELVVRLIERSTESLVSETTEHESLTVLSYDSTLSFHPYIGRLELEVPAGEFVVDAQVTDISSGESARRRQAVHVASVETGETFISRILLEGTRTPADFEPIISLHTPAEMDSLRASIQLYNLPDPGELEISMRLVRFESDTTVASPPYWLEPSRGSLAYRGVDYGVADTIQATRRVIRGASESAAVEFFLPRLDAGVYRLHIEGRDGAGTLIVDRERTLSVKNPTFPQIALLEDLIESLAYIAYDNEIEAIREGTTPAERKRRFDAFWGALVSNRNVAANLIELYYGRIEEANLFFTGYKEGWRTDRGMIFTILGPPVYIDRRVETEIWYYSYGDRDPVNTYVFERVHRDRDEPFETYVLQRRPYYQNEWGRAIDQWRDGDVL